MKFLIESDSDTLEINKYNKDDFILQSDGVIMIGRDASASTLRVPRLEDEKTFISKKQIAQCPYEGKDYFYIPSDQIPKDTLIYNHVLPLAVKRVTKNQ